MSMENLVKVQLKKDLTLVVEPIPKSTIFELRKEELLKDQNANIIGVGSVGTAANPLHRQESSRLISLYRSRPVNSIMTAKQVIELLVASLALRPIGSLRLSMPWEPTVSLRSMLPKSLSPIGQVTSS